MRMSQRKSNPNSPLSPTESQESSAPSDNHMPHSSTHRFLPRSRSQYSNPTSNNPCNTPPWRSQLPQCSADNKSNLPARFWASQDLLMPRSTPMRMFQKKSKRSSHSSIKGTLFWALDTHTATLCLMRRLPPQPSYHSNSLASQSTDGNARFRCRSLSAFFLYRRSRGIGYLPPHDF